MDDSNGGYEMTADQTVSAVLRALLAARRVTQEEVADVLGVTRPAISARLAGVTTWKVGEVAALARHFGLSVADFVEPGARLGLVVNHEAGAVGRPGSGRSLRGRRSG